MTNYSPAVKVELALAQTRNRTNRHANELLEAPIGGLNLGSSTCDLCAKKPLVAVVNTVLCQSHPSDKSINFIFINLLKCYCLMQI